MATIEGGCHCGAVRYAIDAAGLKRHGVCHCSDCRRAAGAPFVPWAIVDRSALTVVSGEPKEIASSENGRRAFCADCGTGLLYWNTEWSKGTIDVQSSTFDDPQAYAPEVQVQMAERLKWLDDLPTMPGHLRFSTN